MNVAEKIYAQVKTLPESTAKEVLDFVEFIKMRQEQADDKKSSPGTERLQRMQNARGLWKDRSDLPDFQVIRREWDRANGKGS